MTLYMIVEHYKNDNAISVYRRFRDFGRLAPEGLSYISSWVDFTYQRCYQLMETQNEHLLEQWIKNWNDIVDFEFYPVMTSKEAYENIKDRL